MVAVIRYGRDRPDICLVPSLGGPVQVVHELTGRVRGLDWSPDSTKLVFGFAPHDGVFSINILDLESGSAWQLTPPEEGNWGDLKPRFSPQGDRIAFIRNSPAGGNVIGLVSMDGSPAEAPLIGFRRIFDLDWYSGGQDLVVSGRQREEYGLWRLTPGSDRNTRLAVSLEVAKDISLCQATGTLAISVPQADLNLVRYDLATRASESDQELPGEVVFASTLTDYMPAIDPAGERIAFCSDRTGHPQIYLGKSGGESVVALTNFQDTGLSYLEWSPDGSQLVFAAGSEEQGAFIGLMDPLTGQWQEVAPELGNVDQPMWSEDGQWLHFFSNHDNGVRHHKTRPDGTGLHTGELTSHIITIFHRHSDDSLYFLEHLNPGLRRLDPQGNRIFVAEYPQTTRILSSGELNNLHYYVVFKDKAYTLVAHDLASAKRDTLGLLPGRCTGPLAIFPDGTAVLVATLSQSSTDLVMVPEVP